MWKLVMALSLFILVATPALAADDAFTRGVAALEDGRARVARVEFMNAIKAAPEARQPHLMQARTYLVLEDGVAAEAEVRRAAALGARAADTRHMLAEAQLLQGNPEGALITLSAGPSRFPAAAARMKGRAHQQSGRTAAAALAFSEALELAPRDHRLWIDIARFRLATGDRAGANAAADRALQLKPRHVPAIVLRGTLVRTQYGLKAGLPWFDRAAAIDPDYVPAWTERAATLGDLGRTREMLVATRKALALQPGNYEARYLQAVLAARARNFRLARSLFAKIAGPVASSPGGLLLGGVIDIENDNAEQAIGRLEALLAIQPGNFTARRLLGLAHVRRGDGRSAIAALRPLEGEEVADPYALTLLAAAYSQAGNRPVAQRALTRAASPGNGSGLLPVDLGGSLPTVAFERAAALRWDLGHGSAWSGLANARALAAESPGAPEAHLMVGDALMLSASASRTPLRHAEVAAETYQRAANIAFTEATALRLVEALQFAGDAERARVVLALFLDQNPRSLAGHRLLANMRLAARDWPGAIAAYERVRARTGDHDAVLLNNLAWARFDSGAPRAGLALAARAYRLAPANAATADAHGWMLLKTGGDRVRALTLLHKAWPTR